MRGRGRNASFVNIASNAAFVPLAYVAVHAASKSYVLLFSEATSFALPYVYDANTDTSDVVIDAQDVAGAPAATIQLPVRVPFGFRGAWSPDTAGHG